MRFGLLASAVFLLVTACSGSTPPPADAMPSSSAVPSVVGAIPRPDHVVIVILENKNFSSISGNGGAPYWNALAAQGASFSNSFAITHPSQPNYVALFSGGQHGITDDSCPHAIHGAPNLASQLVDGGFTFAGYSEAMPSDGYTGCSTGRYARKHNPWVNFDTVPASSNLRYDRFPSDYAHLPTLSFVIPDMCNDMHDCSVATGDTWMRTHLDGYAHWAKAHNSLLIVTFDEDDFTSVNRIATVFVGQSVRQGVYPERITHYNVLRTLEDAYGLAPLGNAAAAAPITSVWSVAPRS